jgi:hypothetical protein
MGVPRHYQGQSPFYYQQHRFFSSGGYQPSCCCGNYFSLGLGIVDWETPKLNAATQALFGGDST